MLVRLRCQRSFDYERLREKGQWFIDAQREVLKNDLDLLIKLRYLFKVNIYSSILR